MRFSKDRFGDDGSRTRGRMSADRVGAAYPGKLSP